MTWRWTSLWRSKALPGQEVDGLEVLVHDDASADDTTEVVAGFNDPRIRYRRHPRMLGVARNRNSCRDPVQGTYLAWLDSDDQRLPGTPWPSRSPSG